MKIHIALLLILTFVSCKSKNKSKNTLNLAITTKIATLDPAVSYDTVSAKVIYQIYESLYEYDYLQRPYQLKPLLAKAMPTVEENGLKYTIKLKKNIYYHDSPAFKGKKVTVKALDIINQLKRVAFKPTDSHGWWLFEGKILGLDEFRKTAKDDFSDFYSKEVKGLKALDEHTLVIRLNAPYPQLKFALAMAFSSPMPRELIDYYKNNFNQDAIGTGPYKLKRWDKGLSVKLTKFDDYHQMTYPTRGDSFAHQNKLLKDAGKKLPFIKNITFHIHNEDQTRWLNFLTKKVDMIILTKDHFVNAIDQEGRLTKEFTSKDIKLQVSPTLTYWWLSFNMQDPILGKNLKLRQAISHSINIDRYIRDFTNNVALKANSIYPPGITGYNPSNETPYKYDINLAKLLLKEAGFPGGKGLPTFTYDVRGGATTARQMGTFIQKELSRIGIKIKVITNSFPGFLNKARTGQLQIWQGGWAMDYPDPENVIQLLITKNQAPGPNSSYYSNPRVDELYNQIALANNKKEVLKITNEVEQTVMHDLPWIMQFYSRNYILYHGRLKNFRSSELMPNYLKYLRLE